ncbi:hypothetical protein AOQ84DRAFT_353357 [Glonium stellatum]|uniref:Uncharacterized protein n=1 Tax=Glonium stellatum TaxID=574774 RepID=A0A8E2F570_9PEZI|nr:hypothetical protein AOQ84DRAFT_353357 [Glonium stellatum]
MQALPPSPSYTSNTTTSAHIIFNPPSSTPSVYHTPLKFLPKSDRRRQLYAAAMASSTQTALSTRTPVIAQTGTPLSVTSFPPPKPSAPLPPPVRAPYEKKYHLTDVEIAEIRSLRSSDPDKWTRERLAEKFGCSQFFVSLVCKAPEKGKMVERQHQEARERWGRRRREAKEDRNRRKDTWGREL